MHRHRVLIALALLAAAALARPGDGSAEVRTVVKDGIVHVENGAAPRDGIEDLPLTELWRRGGEDDEEILLGIVSSVLTDAEGNLYVLDSQLHEVLVIAPDGRLLRTLGRQGEGPGESANAQQMTFLPGGKALGVAQSFPGKLVGINLDGSPAGDIKIGGEATAGGFLYLVNAQLGGDNLVLAGIDIAFNQAEMTQTRRHFVRGYAADGTQRSEYHHKDVRWVFDASFKLSETDSDYVWWRLGVDRQGRVLIGEQRNEYRISVYGRDGELERVFGRAYESLPRSAELLARYERMMEAQARQLPPGTGREVAKLEQDLWGLRCQLDGTVWVGTSRGIFAPPAGVFTVWDVFDADGAFVRQVQARVPGRPGADMMMVTEHGYAVMITGFWDAVLAAMGAAGDFDEAEPMQIICYRIG